MNKKINRFVSAILACLLMLTMALVLSLIHICRNKTDPPVAKLDIAADSDSEGRGFESLRAGQERNLFCLPRQERFLLSWRIITLERMQRHFYIDGKFMMLVINKTDEEQFNKVFWHADCRKRRGEK